MGHIVTGVDVVASKVDAVNSGRAPFVEKGLTELTAAMVASGRLTATMDTTAAVSSSEITLVCVGTPSREDGSLDTHYVSAVCCQIGEVLRELDSYHLIVLRSTVLPGITRGELVPLLEKLSSKKAGIDFGFCFNPEFLREGSAIEDFFQPSRTVIGELDQRSGDVVASIYQGIPGSVIRTNFETAEIVKYTDNWWHALKVAFANEVGTLAKNIGVDGREAMAIFTLDKKLNLSAKYLLPGLAFGGSCLPKDLRALSHLARAHGLELPLLQAVIPSNEAHLARTLQLIRATGAKRVGFLGLTFKPGTDDVRESPAVELIAALLLEGFDVCVHDESVKAAELVGANRAFLLRRIPDLFSCLIEDPDLLCGSVDAVVVIHDTPKYRALIEQYHGDLLVVDCTRIAVSNVTSMGQFSGLERSLNGSESDLPGYEGTSAVPLRPLTTAGTAASQSISGPQNADSGSAAYLCPPVEAPQK
jgi:GDP-mannose 6-dehydrogenase